jgi:hypothetical protein
MRAIRLILMAVAAEMIVGSGLALAQGEGGPEYKGGGHRPPAAPATPAQGAPNPLPRSSPTDAALSNNHYLSHGPQVNTSHGQTVAGSGQAPSRRSNTATQ